MLKPPKASSSLTLSPPYEHLCLPVWVEHIQHPGPHCMDMQTHHYSLLSFCQEHIAKPPVSSARKWPPLPQTSASLLLKPRSDVYRRNLEHHSGWINPIRTGLCFPFCMLCFKDAPSTASKPLHPQLKGKCNTRYVKCKNYDRQIHIVHIMCPYKQNL